MFEGYDFTELAARILRIADRNKPTPAQKQNLWRAAVETVSAHAQAGRGAVETKRAMVRWLWTYGPRLAASERALARNLELKAHRLQATRQPGGWTAAGERGPPRAQAQPGGSGHADWLRGVQTRRRPGYGLG